MSDLMNTPARDVQKKKSAAKEVLKKHGFTLSVVLMIFLVTVCILLLRGAIRVTSESISDSYRTAYNSEKSDAYEALYQNAYDRAKQKYHVSNTVVISIANITESEKLEVLKANHVEFITVDREDNSDNITAWIEVSGTGVFVVDLQVAEFIVDNAHRYVCVRIPYPELSEVSINTMSRKLFKDGILKGSISDGVHLTVDMINEAQYRIRKALMSNQYIQENAETVAASMITNLVKELNPDIPNLSVEVEFID